MELFGVGLPEAGLVFVLALILVGPERFPELARQAGRWYRTVRAFTDAVMVDVRAAVDEIEEEIADKNDGLRPIQELQAIRREFTQIGEEVATEAQSEVAAASIEASGEPGAAPAGGADTASPDGASTGGVTSSATVERAGTGGT